MKYWDIKPKKKKRYQKEKLNKEIMPYRYPKDVVPIIPDFPKRPEIPCLHKSCPTCRGTGQSIYGGPCFHMISCPCPSCTPWVNVNGTGIFEYYQEQSEVIYV